MRFRVRVAGMRGSLMRHAPCSQLMPTVRVHEGLEEYCYWLTSLVARLEGCSPTVAAGNSGLKVADNTQGITVV